MSFHKNVISILVRCIFSEYFAQLCRAAALIERWHPLSCRNFSSLWSPAYNLVILVLCCRCSFQNVFVLPMSSRRFPPSLLSDWMYLVLCWGLWYTHSWVSCRVKSMGLYSFFSFTHPAMQFNQDHSLKMFQCVLLASLSGVWRCMDLCLRLQFDSMDLCDCFYADTMLFVLA